MVNNQIQKKYYNFINLSFDERKRKSEKINNRYKDKVIIATLFDNNIKLNKDFDTFIFDESMFDQTPHTYFSYTSIYKFTLNT